MMPAQHNTFKLFSLFLVSFTCVFMASFGHADAADCSSIKRQIEHYENLRRNGGSAKSMNRWTATGHRLEDKLRNCNRDSVSSPVIQTASGSESVSGTKKDFRPRHISQRKNTSENPQLQKLTQTCNYWIDVTNENPSQDNANFRNTACHAVDNYQEDSGSITSSNDMPAVRKLKDCIKANNLVDSDVNDCMKGIVEPTWKK